MDFYKLSVGFMNYNLTNSFIYIILYSKSDVNMDKKEKYERLERIG